MITINEAVIDKLIFHKISNSDNLSVINDKPCKYENEDEECILKNIFLKPFLSQSSTCEFKHDIALEYNPLFQLVKDIYNGEDFVRKSKSIFTHLKTISKHPNIKDGDLFIVKYEDIVFNNRYYEGVGIYKIEKKQNFIEIEKDSKTLNLKKGIGSKKLDKACLVLFTDEPYTLFVIDNTDMDTEYWKNDFINMKPKSDFINSTNHFLQAVKGFTQSQSSHISKADQVDLLNKSVKFFKSKDNFDMEEFGNEVMENPDIIKSFKKYKRDYEKDYDIDIDDNFPISESAVKKQARVLRKVIKLDKNFHIYIHGDRSLLEQGADKKGKFYKVYYQEEN